MTLFHTFVEIILLIILFQYFWTQNSQRNQFILKKMYVIPLKNNQRNYFVLKNPYDSI